MFRQKNMREASFSAPDDQRLFAIYKDFSGGVNERVHARDLSETQAVTLENADLSTPATVSKRPGSVLIGDDIGDDSPVALHNFQIQGANDQFLMYEDTSLFKWEGTGSWTSLKTDFTTSTDVGILSAKESGLAPDDVVIIQNDQDNAFRLDYDGNFQDLGNTAGTGTDSPPKSSVMTWYNNRMWILKDDQLYFSAPYSSDYSSAFDTAADVYRIPVGDERGLVATRNLGIIILGEQGIWALFPSSTPAATDRPEPIVVDVGCVSKKGWAVVGDDVFFFAKDGLRALRRTEQDKLQLGTSYPISYILKDQFENISWANISKLTMDYYDNKLFIAVPTGSATFDTWIYYVATNSFSIMTDVAPSCWGKYKVDGEERLYYGKTGDGKVYRAWYGFTDEGTTTTNGTAISETIVSKSEDFKQPLVWKVGGEVEIEAAAAGSLDTIKVEARVDEGDYSTLGTMLLTSGTSPTLPIALPFTLSEEYIIREKFHLNDLGRFRNVQVRLTNSSVNTVNVKIYNINLVAFPEEYRTE